LPPSRPLGNAARGEVLVSLGGAEVRLCVTLGALAALELTLADAGFAVTPGAGVAAFQKSYAGK